MHSAKEISVTLKPAESGSGLRLVRTDVGKSWAIGVRTIIRAVNCTAIGDSDHSVMFLEHLMASLWAAGISDLQIEVSGLEIPLFDGSAAPLLQLIRQAGVRDLGDALEPVVVRQALRVGDDTRFVAALPSGRTEFAYLLDHPHPLVGMQYASYRADTDDFAADIAPTRTWGLASELMQAQAAGLLCGGSEANSLIVFDDHLSADPGTPQAFAKHKLQDLIGDLYLLGRPVVGIIIACRTGHRDNHQLAAKLAGEQ